jgi:hypothetical protein
MKIKVYSASFGYLPWVLIVGHNGESPGDFSLGAFISLGRLSEGTKRPDPLPDRPIPSQNALPVSHGLPLQGAGVSPGACQ